MAVLPASANISWPIPAQGSINQQIQYRVVGASTWTTYATVGPTVSSAVVQGLPPNNYEFQILNICPNGVTTASALTTHYVCSCPGGYTKNTTNGDCEKSATQSPEVVFSNYCLAASTHAAYAAVATRIYAPGFTNADIASENPSSVYAEYIEDGQWVSTDATDGPMNRCAVWVDSDCDGFKDNVAYATQTTISYAYNSDSAKRMYVGIGADNIFTLKVNGAEIARTPEDIAPAGTGANNTLFFGIWHVFPVQVTKGWNYFNAVVTGDDLINNAIGMVVYNIQDPATFNGSHSSGSTYDLNLNIVFSTGNLRGQHIDIATCDTGYSLDTTGGAGAYICRKTDTVACG